MKVEEVQSVHKREVRCMCMKQYHRGESYVPVAVAALGCTEHVHIVYIVCKEASVRV